MKLNEQIRENRNKVSLTQEQVANYFGVSTPIVNKWESEVFQSQSDYCKQSAFKSFLYTRTCAVHVETAMLLSKRDAKQQIWMS